MRTAVRVGRRMRSRPGVVNRGAVSNGGRRRIVIRPVLRRTFRLDNMAAMHRSDLSYELPPELIAQKPLPERSDSRLLVLDARSGRIEDRVFRDLPDLLDSGDVLVFNDTRVIRARLFGHKASGGKVELLIERIVTDQKALTHIRASKAPKTDTVVHFEQGFRAKVLGREEDLFLVEFLDGGRIESVLDAVGHIPLPPYIERADDEVDQARYQTLYGSRPGAIAAPTAGLHFDEAIFERLAQRNVERAFVTLHVGSGTFQPLRSERLEDHHMHAECCEVDDLLVESVRSAKARGNRVVAVGTTAVRSLETAALSGVLRPFCGETRLFIRPGFPFRCVDAMLTNFHLPESTLLALVCAFAGYDHTMAAYRHAVERRYRFFSYGDAMLVIDRCPGG